MPGAATLPAGPEADVPVDPEAALLVDPEADLVDPGQAVPSVVVQAWVRRATPSPTPWRRGTVELTPGTCRWRPRKRAAEPGPRDLELSSVDLTRVRGTTVREVWRVDRSCTVFGLATDRELLELAVLPTDLPSVRAALRSCRPVHRA